VAVVVDEVFFDAMGDMQRVAHISNGDIVWFIVGYDEDDAHVKIAPREFVVTTLDGAITGLTATKPVSQQEFEAEIRDSAVREAHTI